ncbi:DNA replication and repair protein RecF [Weissella uvarum]|uniref:DNA replication/repair protein RecF n=1 Tax=Weissella uvarum TaxID=1479233 RepID=UPI00195F9D57|nr:DNA replication/repair protein RecF [Weissella uvarum]MBM7616959.1 DNA replication and repair protein RecF [Weissella uvarum]MCM0594592.1 DNA replication/repair protein RecF [Weissella uvarum]
MFLTELKLKNFRNYQDTHVTFSPGVNVFLGANAQGKTNLLEAIYVLALTRSHRTNTDKDLIRMGEQSAKVAGVVEKQSGTVPLSLTFTNKGKQARVNHLNQSKLADYVGNLNVILFAPEDLALVKGSPAVRRNFIDREFSQMSPKYLYVANQYRASLKQRNQYLKQLQSNKQSDQLFLEVLTERLVIFAAELIVRRIALLKDLNRAAQPIQSEITQGQEQLEIEYVSQITDVDQMDEEQIKAALVKEFERVNKRELMEGVTKVGPHRDDLRFLVNGVDVATFGSQGQQRTTALAVKLAEIDLMKEQTGEYPVLLLDDVLSELDASRQTHLLKAMQNKVQTFITTPSLSDVAKQLIADPKVFKVSAGQLQEKNDD